MKNDGGVHRLQIKCIVAQSVSLEFNINGFVSNINGDNQEKYIYFWQYAILLLTICHFTSGNMPSSFRQYGTSDNMPFTSDNMPFTSDNMPLTSDNMPFTSDNMPFTSDNMLFTSDNMPSYF
jgi:hypothetical protein